MKDLNSKEPICAVCDRAFSDHVSVISHDFVHQKTDVRPSKTVSTEHEQALKWARGQNFTSVAARYAKLCAEAYDIARSSVETSACQKCRVLDGLIVDLCNLIGAEHIPDQIYRRVDSRPRPPEEPSVSQQMRDAGYVTRRIPPREFDVESHTGLYTEPEKASGVIAASDVGRALFEKEGSGWRKWEELDERARDEWTKRALQANGDGANNGD